MRYGTSVSWALHLPRCSPAKLSGPALQEASLKESCERPENKSIIERERRKQAVKVLQVKQQRDAWQFQQKVLLTGLTFAQRKDP